MRFVTREEIEEIDRRAQEEFGIPGETLMDRAGKAVADEVLRRTKGDVLVVCGKGKNGGDGRVAAKYLSAERRVRVVDAKDPFEIVEPVVVDAIFGTGLRRPVEGAYRRAIETLNAADAFVVAIDIPSGLDANTGKPMPVAVAAEVTVTMGLPKVGFRGAEAWTGEVVVAEIGYPKALVS